MSYVYLIRSIKVLNWVYVGHTQNLERRLLAHNRGEVRSTKRYAPFELIYFEKYDKLADAIRREKQLKTSRSRKDELIRNCTKNGPIV